MASLAAVVATAAGSDVRAQFRAINSTIEHLVRAVSADGAAGAKARLSSIILEHERARVLKDRRWFLPFGRSEEHTSELQSLIRTSYAVFCLQKKPTTSKHTTNISHSSTIITQL